jgi:hypothetical protein
MPVAERQIRRHKGHFGSSQLRPVWRDAMHTTGGHEVRRGLTTALGHVEPLLVAVRVLDDLLHSHRVQMCQSGMRGSRCAGRNPVMGPIWALADVQ